VIYKVRVARTEVYIDDVDVEAATEEEAFDKVQDVLDSRGWDAVFPYTEGNYESCESDVICVERKETS